MKRRAAKGSHCHLDSVCCPITGRQAHVPEALRDLLMGDLSDLHHCGSELQGETGRDGTRGRRRDLDRRPSENELSSTGHGDGTHTVS